MTNKELENNIYFAIGIVESIKLRYKNSFQNFSYTCEVNFKSRFVVFNKELKNNNPT